MPLSQDPERRARQIQNLRQGGRGAPFPKPKAALDLALAALPANPRVRATAAEVQKLLAGEDTSHIGPADAATVLLLAAALWGLKLCCDDISRYGPFTADGKARQSVELANRYLKTAMELSDKLALSPSSRVRLGLNMARTDSLTDALLAAHANRGDVAPSQPVYPAQHDTDARGEEHG